MDKKELIVVKVAIDEQIAVYKRQLERSKGDELLEQFYRENIALLESSKKKLSE